MKAANARLAHHFGLWCTKLAPAQWCAYRNVLSAVHRVNTPFAVGGGLAAMTYADQFRDSRDLDLYIEPESAEAVVSVLNSLGFRDIYGERPYDRKWIYRTCCDDTIVDVMWAMANQRSQVDRSWLLGPIISVDGLTVRLLAPEELLWTKLYVMQRDRCDWPDALNIISVVGPSMDWNHLIERIEDDVSLLSALLCMYRWLCPDDARNLPAWLWDHLQLSRPAALEGSDCSVRASLLDARPWFTPTLDNSLRLSGAGTNG